MAVSKIPNQNYVPATATSSFEQTGWQMSVSDNTLVKVGNTVTARLGVSRAQNVPAGGYSFMRVPSGFRPAGLVYVTATDGGFGTTPIQVGIDTNGDVRLVNQGAVITSLFFGATWATN